MNTRNWKTQLNYLPVRAFRIPIRKHLIMESLPLECSKLRGHTESTPYRRLVSYPVKHLFNQYLPYSSGDDDTLLKTPLESLYNELGLKGPEVIEEDTVVSPINRYQANHYRQYPVYEPKQSSEYLAVRNNNCRDAPPPAYGVSSLSTGKEEGRGFQTSGQNNPD